MSTQTEIDNKEALKDLNEILHAMGSPEIAILPNGDALQIALGAKAYDHGDFWSFDTERPVDAVYIAQQCSPGLCFVVNLADDRVLTPNGAARLLDDDRLAPHYQFGVVLPESIGEFLSQWWTSRNQSAAGEVQEPVAA